VFYFLVALQNIVNNVCAVYNVYKIIPTFHFMHVPAHIVNYKNTNTLYCTAAWPIFNLKKKNKYFTSFVAGSASFKYSAHFKNKDDDHSD
jgi:hypothetical protein